MKISVVGCGWLGLPLAKHFVENGFTVYGSTTSESKLKLLQGLKITPFLWDVSSNEDYPDFLTNCDVLVINIPPSKVNGDKSYSLCLLNVVKQISNKTKVILVSTTGVYPNDLENASIDFLFDKMDKTKETVLSEIKLSEQLSERLSIVRMAGLIGEKRHPINSLHKKREIPNGDAPLNLIHLNDAIGIISKIIKEEYWGKIINGCYPEHPTKKEYYTESANYFKLKNPTFLDGGHKNKSINSISTLNYKYTTSIYDFDKV